MIDSSLWMTAVALSVLLLFKIRKVPRLPLLVVYVIFDLVRHAILFTQRASPDNYFYAFWGLKIVESVIKMALAVQLAKIALGKNRRAIVILAPAGCALLVLAIVRAGPPESFPQMALLMQQSVFISGLILFVAWLASVRFEQPYRMIAAGLAFNLAAQFVATLAQYPRLMPLCGVATLAIWLVALIAFSCRRSGAAIH